MHEEPQGPRLPDGVDDQEYRPDPGTHTRLGAECLAGRHQVIAGLDPWDIGVNRSSGAVVAAATVHRTGRKCTPRSNDLYLPCFKPWLFGTP